MPIDRHAEIAGRLEEIAGQHAEAAGIERQRLAEAEFHAEIGDPAERRILCRLEPGRPVEIGAPRTHNSLQLLHEGRVGRQFARPAFRQVSGE